MSRGVVRPRASLAKSGTLSSVFVLYGAVAAFAASLIVSNGVGSAGSGQFFSIMALFAIAISASVFGADTGLVRTVSAQRAVPGGTSTRALFGYALPPVLVSSTVVALAACAAGLWWPGLDQGTRTAVWVAAPFLVPAAVMTLCFGVLRGTHRVIEFTALQNGLLPSLRVAAVLLAVLAGGSMGLLAGAWSVPVLLVLGVCLWLILPYLRRSDAPQDSPGPDDAAPAGAPAAAPETRRSFWSFSSARGVATLVETLLEWIDVLLIGLFLGPAAAGIYGAVNRCVRVGAMVEHTARIVTGPAISSALAVGDRLRARSIFVGTTRLMVLLAWPFYLTLAVFGPAVLGFFGPDFPAAAPVLWLICPAMMIAASAGGVQSVLLMAGRSRWQLLNKLAALSVSAVLCLTLIPRLGLMGASIAWAGAVLVDCGLAAYQVRTRLGIRASAAELAPAVGLALGVVGLGALLIRFWLGAQAGALLLHLLLCCGLYLILLIRWRSRLGLDRLRRPGRGRKTTAENITKEEHHD